VGGHKLNFIEYQEKAARTDKPHKNKLDGLRNATMGMVGEAAETLEHMKKVLDQGHSLSELKLLEEAGDCLWYIAKLARLLGYNLEELAIMNITKLELRYPNGFDAKKSINRSYEDE